MGGNSRKRRSVVSKCFEIESARQNGDIMGSGEGEGECVKRDRRSETNKSATLL